jgi:hypothetical protein
MKKIATALILLSLSTGTLSAVFLALVSGPAFAKPRGTLQQATCTIASFTELQDVSITCTLKSRDVVQISIEAGHNRYKSTLGDRENQPGDNDYGRFYNAIDLSGDEF